WQLIEDKDAEQSVLAGAAPKKIVSQYAELFSAADLSIEALEIEPVAICRSLLPEESPRFSGEGKNYIIIDLGARRSSIVYYSSGTILFSMSLPLAGEALTDAIAKNLKINREKAEKAKILYGLDASKGKGIINKILSGMITELNKKIKESLDFYQNYYTEEGLIQEIILCGGGANVNGIEKAISDSVAIEVKKGDALINLEDAGEKLSQLLKWMSGLNINCDYTRNINSLIQDPTLTFATAIGLALRGVFADKK
ncbi:MAG: pilus assembly protein PilM, partial [Patescibacteria group bacterium]|nr:pilus assembly protein PilM [Patescibacteria group bacterium]